MTSAPALRRNTAVAVLLVTFFTDAGAAGRELRFHHLHLADGLDFYARLFEPGVTQRTKVAGFEALRSGPMLLLFGRPSTTQAAPERSSAIWHFGWGDVKIGDTYLLHARQEVEWEPPLPPGKLHLHLQSPSPAAAAAWYRDVLGAAIEVLPGTAEGRPVAVRPELRLAEAAVRLGDFGMVIHRTNDALVSTRGQRADHIAFECESLDRLVVELADRKVRMLEPISPFADGRHAMIEGPDSIAIELIEAEGPALARRRDRFAEGPLRGGTGASRRREHEGLSTGVW